MEVRTSAKIETGNVAERIQDGYNDIGYNGYNDMATMILIWDDNI